MAATIGSMDFKFEINKGLLIYAALLGNKSRSFHSPKLKNILYEKYINAYQLLWDPRKIFVNPDYGNAISTASSDLINMFLEFEKDTAFENLLFQTEKYKAWLENQWRQNRSAVNKHLKDILKIDIPADTAIVNVIEPTIGGGTYLGNKTIYWGHSEDWQNYSIVYLVHEYLHTFIPNGSVEHSIIELATDNELRLRLNGKGEYFEQNGKDIGHENLKDFENNILLRWKEYLRDKEMNIFEFIEVIKNDSPF